MQPHSSLAHLATSIAVLYSRDLALAVMVRQILGPARLRELEALWQQEQPQQAPERERAPDALSPGLQPPGGARRRV